MSGFGALSSVKPTSFIGFWNYNRTNYEFDIGMRMKRFSAGRAQAVAQTNMFRDDIADLTGVPVKKMNIYTPIATVCCGYCVTVYIEGRSGLKFPAPPTFISGIYLQCLGIGFVFMGLAAWLAFHSGMRAMVAAVQMRTRTVRLPLPTQRQLDQARKLGSSYEETSVYDMFRVPYVMPNLADTPDPSDDEGGSSGGSTGGKTKGKAGKGSNPSSALIGKKSKSKAMRMPYRPGCPEWIEREMEHYEENPKIAPSTHGNGPAPEPYEHFEMIRKAQKDWWGAEVYARITLLTGHIHFLQGFGYWLVIHCIAELGYVWCAEVLAACFSAAIWLIFHLDILPLQGGFWPVEACGPFLAAITLELQYSHNPTKFMIDLSRVLAIGCICLNIIFTIRLLMVATPSNVLPAHAREQSNQKNLSAPTMHPSWLPTAYQVVQYLVAPPKPSGSEEILEDDPMRSVNMMPWRATRGMYLVTIALWFVLLVGRIVECATGERMLVTNPGFAPWTRIGQWDGWESGPITSKHYAHVSPMRGHFAWKYGQGPQGFQELWPSDLYGFAPEADAWWGDEQVPFNAAPPDVARHDPRDSPLAVIPHPPIAATHHAHEAEHAGEDRRLGSKFLLADTIRPLVPAAVQWPSKFEPDFVACAPSAFGSHVFTFSATGNGTMISGEAALGENPGVATPFPLRGLPVLGRALSATWGHGGLLVVTSEGLLHDCSHVATAHQFTCQALSGPPVPVFKGYPAVVVHNGAKKPLLAVVASEGGEVNLFERNMGWEQVDRFQVPYDDSKDVSEQPSLVSLSAFEDHVIAILSDGATLRWELVAGRVASRPHRDTPAAAAAYAAIGSPRAW
eukprot:CAMPEP_0169107816 /NCGR_PEP_ID=MMETSP1015-20121227/25092_1 /TAXON_ID=342587 /ORGANISM="Karlodinium micrum, Strain CCMP2283" /LENGTH=845 /DNA_ID=CAMNT_0009169389 /DNA_START=18 /DNA_END=2552 /DNA_ORIENTATION=-